MLLTSNGKKLVSYDKVYCTTNALVFLIEISGAVVSLFIVFDNLLTGLTKDIDVILTYQLLISTFAPSMVPSVTAPLSMNFIFPVPLASLEARDICSEISQAGISFSAALTL